jgi:hypothetical protein
LSRDFDLLAGDLLSPMAKIPRRPIRLGLFGLPGMLPATMLARLFQTPQARALFAGNAAHSWTPLTQPPSSAIALMFGAVAHRYGWPCVVGGTARLGLPVRLFWCAATYFAFAGGASAIFSSAVGSDLSDISASYGSNTSSGLPPCAGASAK